MCTLLLLKYYFEWTFIHPTFEVKREKKHKQNARDRKSKKRRGWNIKNQFRLDTIHKNDRYGVLGSERKDNGAIINKFRIRKWEWRRDRKMRWKIKKIKR